MTKKTRLMIDASALKKAACDLAIFNTVVLGYKEKINSIQVEFGSAFHKFRAVFRAEGLAGWSKGINAALDYFSKVKYYVPSHKKYMDNPDYLRAACNTYVEAYMNDTVKPVQFEGQSAIELPFCLPYYVDDEVEVLLAGTMDELSFDSNDSIYIINDCKVTSLYDLDGFLKDFLLSGQLLFYRNILDLYAKEFPEHKLAEINRSNPALMIDCLNTKGKDEIRVQRSLPWIVKRETLSEYKQLLHCAIMQLVGSVKEYKDNNLYPLRTGMLCDACDGKYQKCLFHDSCCSPDQDSRIELLDTTLIKKEYNPLAFSEI